MPPTDPPEISLAPGADENGFAVMLADLLRQNLADHPAKRRTFAHLVGRVALVVVDADVAITMKFEAGKLQIFDGIVGLPDVTIRASADDVTRLSLVELLPRLGLPDPRGANTREVLRASHAGRIRVYGALANIPLLVRLTRVMSVS